MSGHSKWATIHRQKGINDVKKGAIFTKLGRAITLAVRQGRGLQLALDKAKQYNMPKENVQRAIDKGSGTTEGDQLHEATFEGFLPGGVAVLVQTLTDNKLRTAQDVRMVLEKNGGKLAGTGAVSYMFDKIYDSESSELVMKPLMVITVADSEIKSKIKNILEKLEDLDDTQKVWTNYA